MLTLKRGGRDHWALLGQETVGWCISCTQKLNLMDEVAWQAVLGRFFDVVTGRFVEKTRLHQRSETTSGCAICLR